MDRTHTARGRLAILLNLIRDEHGLLGGCRESCLPGKFGDEVPYAIMSACVESLGAASSMSAIGVKDMLAFFSPRGGSAALLSRARAGNPKRWFRPSP